MGLLRVPGSRSPDRRKDRRCIKPTLTDVTELHRIEAASRDTEARLRRFIDDAPAAIAMFDTAMCYLAVSRRFVTDYQIGDQTTLIGRSHYEVFPEISDSWRAIHARVLAGESLSSEAEPFTRADGSIDWVRWKMVPWRDSGDAVGGALLFSEDVTDRKAAEAALYDSEARLRLVQQVGGIAYTDRTLPDQTAMISNEFAQIYGLPTGEQRILVSDIIALVHPDDRERIRGITSHHLEHGGKLATEFRICRPNGEVRWISMHTEAFVTPAGEPNRIISAQQDITEIVKAREVLAIQRDALKRSNADLEEFAYAASHDLKAPLRAMGHLAQWIDEATQETASAETKDNLTLLQAQVVRMGMLIDGLLKYSLSGQTDTAVEDVDVGGMVGDIVAMHGSPPGFFIAYEGDKLIPRIHRVALQMVLENLISNSIKHHDRETGRISVTARLLNRFVEFRVSDDGPGIREQFHQRIFKMFQTLRNPDDAETSGIGLAIVKRMVESNGGRIRVESAPPARGTTFVFTWQQAHDQCQPNLDAPGFVAADRPAPMPGVEDVRIASGAPVLEA
jgi:PAS domain S-box-containing protein